MFMGRGAGQMPTASAVMGDIIDVCRNIVHGSCGKIGCSCYKELPVKDISETKSKFFLRIEALTVFNGLSVVKEIAGVIRVY